MKIEQICLVEKLIWKWYAYNQWSPALVRAMQEDELFKEELKEIIDGVLPGIAGEGE